MVPRNNDADIFISFCMAVGKRGTPRQAARLTASVLQRIGQ
ncbi:hypothetical protein B4168_1295 [Anoxybacillus flavithermus]|nr:hypothetical protein B4168_1295 [Anoxybacillus flavithermus]OAO83672.1 hypothetical protein GT23_4166 [Parageobacillus thermoglucosidasius]